MQVAIMFCPQAECECGQDENDDPFLSGCKNKSLPGAIQIKTPVRIQFRASCFCHLRMRSDLKFPRMFSW